MGPISTWLRLVRAGSTFSVFASHDGVQWFPISTPIAFTLAPSTEAGMFAAGGSATFNGASAVTQAAPVFSAVPSRAFSMNGQSAAYRLQWFPAGGTFPGTPMYAISWL